MTNQLNLLCQALQQFGYLRNKDLAGMLYLDDLRKAQRATKAAVDAGDVAERKTPSGSRYALKAEAALLETITGHRDASNAILIDALATGLATGVVTDRQIQLNQAGYTLNDKIPDGLLMDEYDSADGRRVDYSWVEVENSERSGRDVRVLSDWLINTFRSSRNGNVLPEYRSGYLARVIIAISATAADKIESRLKSYIERHYGDDCAEFINEVLPLRVQFIRV